MKKDWQVVHDMLHGSNTSGFGFDSVKQCVNAGDQVWESYLQVHAIFLYYLDLRNIIIVNICFYICFCIMK